MNRSRHSVLSHEIFVVLFSLALFGPMAQIKSMDEESAFAPSGDAPTADRRNLPDALDAHVSDAAAAVEDQFGLLKLNTKGEQSRRASCTSTSSSASRALSPSPMAEVSRRKSLINRMARSKTEKDRFQAGVTTLAAGSLQIYTLCDELERRLTAVSGGSTPLEELKQGLYPITEWMNSLDSNALFALNQINKSKRVPEETREEILLAISIKGAPEDTLVAHSTRLKTILTDTWFHSATIDAAELSIIVTNARDIAQQLRFVAQEALYVANALAAASNLLDQTAAKALEATLSQPASGRKTPTEYRESFVYEDPAVLVAEHQRLEALEAIAKISELFVTAHITPPLYPTAAPRNAMSPAQLYRTPSPGQRPPSATRTSPVQFPGGTTPPRATSSPANLTDSPAH